MASLADIRRQYPQYNDMPDDQLAAALHAKYYADMPRQEFDAKIGMRSVMPSPRAEVEADEKLQAKAMRAATPVMSGGPLGVDVLMGAADIPGGLAQLVARGAEWVTPAAKPLREGVERQQKRQDDFYKRVARPDDQLGAGIGRGTGQALATAPFLAAKPAATLMGRMGQGGGLAGGVAAASPVQDAGDEFWPQKATNVGASMAVGAAAVPLAEVAADIGGKVVNSVVNWWRSRPVKARAINPTDIKNAISEALKENGVDVRTVPTNVIAQLESQAKQAMLSGRALDKGATARAADFAALGMRGSAGQIGRKPSQFAFEQNVSGVKGVGEELADLFGQQNTQLIEKMRGVSPVVGDALDTGKGMISALSSQDAARKGAVTAAYDKARNTVGSVAEVPMGPLAQRAGEAVENFGDAIPGPVISRLRSYGIFGDKQTKSFTVEEADRLRKIVNANWNAADPVRTKALKSINDGIDDTLNAMADQGATFGPAAAKAFGEARDTASARFKLIERVPALKAVVDGDAVPDTFFEKFVLRNKNTTELAALRELIKERPDVVRDIRGQIMSALDKAATGGKDVSFAKFAADSYNKELSRIGTRKLEMFFSPQEIGQLHTIGRVAMSRTNAPVGAPVNYSKSGSAVLDFANRMGVLRQVPMLGSVVKSAGKAAERGMVREAATPDISSVIGSRFNPPIDDATLDAIRRRIGVGGGGLLGFFASGASQN